MGKLAVFEGAITNAVGNPNLRSLSLTAMLNISTTLTFFKANVENPRVTPTTGTVSGLKPLETASCLFFAIVSLVPLA